MLFFFFFQAEDGIRDWSVTGVQTCALPIWNQRIACRARHHATRNQCLPLRARSCGSRSEERRVGKERRSRWSPHHSKKKKKDHHHQTETANEPMRKAWTESERIT